MKRLLLFAILMIGVLAAHAEGYTHLTFETTDGAKISVPASSLSIAISGTTLSFVCFRRYFAVILRPIAYSHVLKELFPENFGHFIAISANVSSVKSSAV